MMRTIPQIARESGADTITNEHVFQWLSEALASDDVDVRADFPLAAGDEYRVVLTAKAKK